MLRGVQRQIIEINQPQSQYFEKVLLFVNPQRSVSHHKLRWEAERVVQDLGAQAGGGWLRSAHKKRWRRRIAAGAACLLLAAVVLCIKFL